MNGKIQYINPEGLLRNPAFSQVVTTQGSGKTIYFGGQDALNVQEEIVGKGNIAEQTEQAMSNLQTALSACGATFVNDRTCTADSRHPVNFSLSWRTHLLYRCLS